MNKHVGAKAVSIAAVALICLIGLYTLVDGLEALSKIYVIYGSNTNQAIRADIVMSLAKILCGMIVFKVNQILSKRLFN